MIRRFATAVPANTAIGAVLLAVVLCAALLSLVWTPYPYAEMNIAGKFQGMSSEHWLGTDQYGRDVLSQLMAGAASSMAVAFIAVGLGGLTGAALGMVAASVGGVTDDAIMRLGDLGFAFPALLFAIMLAAVFGPSLGVAIVAIAFINVPVFARVARAAAIQVWTRDFVLAARAAGVGSFGISMQHVLPNIAAPLIVQATIEFAVAILAEAALSYLGLGAQPPLPSWGRMLAEAQTLLYLAPQLAIYPGLCIVVTVIGFGMLGDGLRDMTDPRLSKERAA
ncbi:ABC transporter permease [Hoeflea sp. WL0058]|uniref:ABC transporter permease n=1 Tax=Flavimaribacter sediminis TaxID=2865987 RepID=A0AAE3D1G5_9HYPH|nr:ABC transporter permease [Flavimaribacter sediminis]MBW8637897.1 ABC transporter permease [Flavimaribacter sediminis]